MKHRLPLQALVAAALALGGCGSVECGPGTQRQQDKDGSLRCVPTAAAPGTIHCDADGGVMLVGGDSCVSLVQCGAGTTLDPATNTCVSSGTVAAHTPDPCPTPEAGKICIAGVVLHLVDRSFLSNEMVRVAVYDPLAFLSNPNSTPLAELTTGDTFIFKNVPAPSTNLVAISVTDPGGTPNVYQLAGVGKPIVPGQSYRFDAFAVKKTDVAAWSASAGKDYDAAGAYVGLYYKDLPASANTLPANETMPAAGVTMFQNGAEPPGTQYFGADLRTVDPALTSTSAVGAAITPAPSLSTFSGSGGGVPQWESFTGASMAHAVFIQRFHPQP